MKTTIFKSIVKKGNNKGVGFISMPLEKRNLFSKNDQIKVIIDSKLEFFSKIKFYGTVGFYVPYKIMIRNKLLNKEVNVKLKIIDGFFTTLGSDGRIYIPQNIAERLYLRSGDIVEIESNMDNKKITRHCRVNFREKKNTKEYVCTFDIKKSKQKGIFKLIRKLPKSLQNANFPKEVLKSFNFAEISNEKIISYYGNRVPIIINSNINIYEIAYYLGCYFADGTKRGTHWGICASTFEQPYILEKCMKN